MWNKPSKQHLLKVGARDSLLSRKQVEEVFSELDCAYEAVWFKTYGDLDKNQSLRDLDKTDFFTRELDQALLNGHVHVTLHSAKDLPDPLPEGLEVVALTKGLDPSDSLVLRENERLKAGMVIGTGSYRREEMVSQMQPDLEFVDIRGTIRERLDRLYERKIDGVVIAEAALIRLGLIHLNRLRIPGDTVPMQGKLAVMARKEDAQMSELFSKVHHEEYSLSGA